MRNAIAAAILLTALAGCQTTSPSADTFCAVNSPQRPSQAEIVAMSVARVRQVLAANRLGMKRCGWKP